MRKCLKQVVCRCVCGEGGGCLDHISGCPLWVVPLSRLRSWAMEDGEHGLRNKRICIHLSALECGCDRTWYFKFLSHGLPSMMACDLAL